MLLSEIPSAIWLLFFERSKLVASARNYDVAEAERASRQYAQGAFGADANPIRLF